MEENQAADRPSKIAILVVAAGLGQRAGEGVPKQYRKLAGRSLLSHTLRALQFAVPQASLTVVIHPDHVDMYVAAMHDFDGSCSTPALGAATRQQSVLAGLEQLALDPPDIVLIHDAARPFVSPALVARALVAAQNHGAAIPGLAVTDTIKQINAARMVVQTPERSNLRAIQTPQGFHFADILAAHRQSAAQGETGLSDDGAVAEHAGMKVVVFEGDNENVKLTTSADFVAAERRMIRACPDIRIGQGYDVHAFEPGDHVWLGGVKIPHDQSLAGHSDADVLLHAITDAVLGAMADGDIGLHFPPTDPQWRGAASAHFLRDAVARVSRAGGFIGHIDATLVCEFPKIGPHRPAIRASIAQIAGLDIGRVAVKATTSERLGFTGRREGMAALAIVTIRLPDAGGRNV